MSKENPMKTPRRKSKSQDIDQQTSSIPVGEAKALFDAVSWDLLLRLGVFIGYFLTEF
jgi:hypothetical protein